MRGVRTELFECLVGEINRSGLSPRAKETPNNGARWYTRAFLTCLMVPHSNVHAHYKLCALEWLRLSIVWALPLRYVCSAWRQPNHGRVDKNSGAVLLKLQYVGAVPLPWMRSRAWGRHTIRFVCTFRNWCKRNALQIFGIVGCHVAYFDPCFFFDL